jgi:hypothetical protein
MFVTGGILEAILSFGVKGGLFDHASWIYKCKWNQLGRTMQVIAS